MGTIAHTLTCYHDPCQAGHRLTGRHHAPHMPKVLGLDAVVAVHLAGVQQAAQTQPIQADGEYVPEDQDMKKNKCN